MNTGFFSFFSGIGLLDLGFENVGYKNLYANEFHKPFIEGYKHSRKILKIEKPLFGYSEDNVEIILENKIDLLNEIYFESKKKFDLVGFVGGPPCPDFSIGGKNRGRHGDNGKLSKTYIDLILKIKPDWFLFENVKGLLRTKKHKEFFDEICRNLKKKYLIDSRMLNSIEIGVPQDRDRIFLFGAKKENLNSLRYNFNWENQKFINKDFIFNEYDWPKTNPFQMNLIKPLNIKDNLTVEYWFNKNNVDKHFNNVHCFKPRAGIYRFQTVSEGDVSKKSFKRLHRYRYSPTVAYGNNEVHLHPILPRRISVSESLSLQSVPKEFELPDTMSLSNMFKSIGNGVPYLLSKYIAERINIWNSELIK